MPVKPTEEQMQALSLYKEGKISPKAILEEVIDRSPVLKSELERQGLITVTED